MGVSWRTRNPQDLAHPDVVRRGQTVGPLKGIDADTIRSCETEECVPRTDDVERREGRCGGDGPPQGGSSDARLSRARSWIGDHKNGSNPNPPGIANRIDLGEVIDGHAEPSGNTVEGIVCGDRVLLGGCGRGRGG